jgi:hypothetical protein
MSEKIALNEQELASALGMSVSFLQKDRCTRRLIPYYRIGDSIRYDVVRVREALIKLEEGGSQTKGRTKAQKNIAAI